MTNSETFDFFGSWSGGKDSCLALHRMITAGNRCKMLFTMINESETHSRSHNITMETLKMQAGALGLNILTGSATWDGYEKEFIRMITGLHNEGIRHGVFGDIDLQPHREWVERVCATAGIIPHEPLWQEKRSELVREFIDAGFRAKIVVVNTKQMPERFLGREIDMELVGELEQLGIDACGENGEYHSFVYHGPLFNRSLIFTEHSRSENEGYAFCNFSTSLG